MNRVMQVADRLWNGTDGFDYLDRMVVFTFMAISLILFIFTLSQLLTPAEQREIAPAINVLGYVLIFFLFWPLIQMILTFATSSLIGWWVSGGEQA